MTSKERIQSALNHQQPDRLAVDFGSTGVSGIHVLAVEKLRQIFGLKKHPVKVIEPYQMLGEVEDDLKQAMGVDTAGIGPVNNMFGFPNNGEWKEFKTFWGQEVLVPEKFNTKLDASGDLLIYPGGDMSVQPCAKMPKASYFFDTIIRQEPIDDANLNVEDNLEEFQPVTDVDLQHFKNEVERESATNRAIVATFGGLALGDIALVPGPGMKNPKGIRDVSEWYMSTMMRTDYVKELFDRQSKIGVQNLEQIFKVVGNKVDVLFICGTDFGTQDSTFCSPETFDDLWMPYYKRINDWIHENTTWKTFKHSCGSVEAFMSRFIEAGFDIINPVQINAVDMDTKHLKDTYGDKLTFWGGGIDTQKVLSFGSPEEVTKQVLDQCSILNKNGGFVFNTVHNVQANVPIENLEAMVKAIDTYNKA